ncbi:hypothetical protein BDN71DRAFT_1434548 [Pleurotus eryngii]|uniref:Uncharacterized protein n=1 Tax=Pleurotus eryngii TaxID=5323 RepID=A0A9P5ZQN6_PLEER|nr:hypothetical protein BDN71DRAFT_1434548 [Pleurotus eryngii]
MRRDTLAIPVYKLKSLCVYKVLGRMMQLEGPGQPALSSSALPHNGAALKHPWWLASVDPPGIGSEGRGVGGGDGDGGRDDSSDVDVLSSCIESPTLPLLFKQLLADEEHFNFHYWLPKVGVGDFWIRTLVPVKQISVRQRTKESEEVVSNASLSAYRSNQGQLHYRKTWVQGHPQAGGESVALADLTSADHNADNKAARAVAKKNMTLTFKILKKSGVGVASLPHSVEADLKDNLNSGDKEEPALVKDKGKGKARNLHNLSAESDKESDADADVGDKENDDEDVDEEAAGAAKGEVAGVGDGSDEDDEGNATIMDVDVIITPHKPAKCDASQSPLTGKHTTPILQILTRKFPSVTESAISVFDVDGEWEVAGPFTLALKDDMDVTWDNDFKLFMLLKSLSTSASEHF